MDDIIQVENDSAYAEAQTRTNKLMAAARRYMMAGVGSVVVARERAAGYLHDTVSPGIDRLAERGESFTHRSRSEVGTQVKQTRELAYGVSQQVGGTAKMTAGDFSDATLHRLGVATATDVEAVNRQLDELSQAVDSLRS